MSLTKKEIILCAAIHYLKEEFGNIPHQPLNIKKGLVVGGYRHHVCRTILANLDPDFYKNKTLLIEGFLTSKNRFVTRAEAHQIHFNKEGTLFSEDLY